MKTVLGWEIPVPKSKTDSYIGRSLRGIGESSKAAKIIRATAFVLSPRFPLATQEELENNNDECSICWERMESARKLECGHLFHK